jgi:hypothetical protein
MTPNHTKTDTTKVTIGFPIAPGGPYKEDAEDNETVGDARAKAMTEFGATADQQYRYYLTHDGSEVVDSATIASVAGHAHAVSFTLVKELVQG